MLAKWPRTLKPQTVGRCPTRPVHFLYGSGIQWQDKDCPSPPLVFPTMTVCCWRSGCLIWQSGPFSCAWRLCPHQLIWDFDELWKVMSTGGARRAFKGNCFSQRLFIMAQLLLWQELFPPQVRLHFHKSVHSTGRVIRLYNWLWVFGCWIVHREAVV